VGESRCAKVVRGWSFSIDRGEKPCPCSARLLKAEGGNAPCLCGGPLLFGLPAASDCCIRRRAEF
jgi:hypothetical protein